MQAVGIMMESTVLYVLAETGRTAADNVTARRTTKMLGYIWVLAWIAWTGPGFIWVVARGLVPGKDDVVPWSFIKWLGYGQ
jgi:hypothetical protein